MNNMGSAMHLSSTRGSCSRTRPTPRSSNKATAGSGAVVMGRRLFDVVNAPAGWNEDMGYGADQTGTPPFFVVTHSPPRDVRLERELGMRFTFVSDLVTAIDQAPPSGDPPGAESPTQIASPGTRP